MEVIIFVAMAIVLSGVGYGLGVHYALKTMAEWERVKAAGAAVVSDAKKIL